MEKNSATGFFNIDLASEGKGAPEWVHLLPSAPNINARDGRRWTYEPQIVIDAFAANNGPLPIDYEHGQDILATEGHPAPAAGWIEQLEIRDGGIWGRVDWTAEAIKLIAGRAYRFLSPSFAHLETGEILYLLGAGLVNRPALEMTALSRVTQNPNNPQEKNKKEEAMSFKAIAKALGLADSADETAVLADITRRDEQRVALCKQLGLDEVTSVDGIIEAVNALGEKTATAIASLETATAKGGDLAAVQKTLLETQTSLASLQEKDQNREIDAALDAATAEGKIPPASRDQYRAMCGDAAGLKNFIALAATLPVICEPSNIKSGKVSTTSVETENPTALANRAIAHKVEQAKLGREISTMTAIAELQEKAQ